MCFFIIKGILAHSYTEFTFVEISTKNTVLPLKERVNSRFPPRPRVQSDLQDDLLDATCIYLHLYFDQLFREFNI